MAQINLLPWREELRQEKKKEFLTQLAFFAFVVIAGCFFWFKWMDASIESQNYRNRLLETEIADLKQKVEEIKELKQRKKDLESRMRVIQDLEGKRSIIVYYFDELAKNLPDGVFFTSVERKGQVFSIEGISESNQRIATLMRNLNSSAWFTNPNLKSVEAAPEEGEQAQTFRMDLSATLPAAEKEEG